MNRRLICLAAGLAATLHAQQTPAGPEAKVLGPQSPVETYDAPVEPGRPVEGLIDFPKLIADPGPNDALAITPSLGRLQLEIVGTAGGDAADAFVPVVGTSWVHDPAALYAALRKKLTVYRDQPLTLGDVRFIQRDITDVYAAAGYPLMSVVVPPQVIADRTLRVQVNEFRLSQYRVVYRDAAGNYGPGAPHWSRDARLARWLDPLLAAPILARDELDDVVARIGRNPYRQARVVFEPGAAQGQSIATVQIDERRPWGLQASYNNYATKASGTHRFSLGGSLGNLPLEDQQISWNATIGTSLAEFQNYSLIYTVPFATGQKLTANVNYSDTASSSIPGIDSASTTTQASLAWDIALRETKAYTWGFSATAMLKRFERESIFGSVSVGGAAFDSVQLVLNHTFSWKVATATNQVSVGATLSFAGVTSRNTDAAFRTFYNSAAGEATTQQYAVNYARVQQLGPLAKALAGWSAETQVSWQLASRELAGSDAFSIGGSAVMRAYPSSAVNGDRGAYIIELLHVKPWTFTHPLVKQVALTPLIEAGTASYVNGGSAQAWDAGFQVDLAGPANIAVSTSLAFAGRTVGGTQRGAARAFVSVRWSH